MLTIGTLSGNRSLELFHLAKQKLLPLSNNSPSVTSEYFVGMCFEAMKTCRSASRFLFTYLFVSVFIHGFLLYVVDYNPLTIISFDVQIILDLASGGPLNLVSMSFWHVHIGLWTFHYFLSQKKDVPGLFCIFSNWALESIISPRSPSSFYWRMAFRNEELSAGCVPCVWDITAFRPWEWAARKYTYLYPCFWYVCANARTLAYKHASIYLFLHHLTICIKIHQSPPIPQFLIQWYILVFSLLIFLTSYFNSGKSCGCLIFCWVKKGITK